MRGSPPTARIFLVAGRKGLAYVSLEGHVYQAASQPLTHGLSFLWGRWQSSPTTQLCWHRVPAIQCFRCPVTVRMLPRFASRSPHLHPQHIEASPGMCPESWPVIISSNWPSRSLQIFFENKRIEKIEVCSGSWASLTSICPHILERAQLYCVHWM